MSEETPRTEAIAGTMNQGKYEFISDFHSLFNFIFIYHQFSLVVWY